MQLLLGDTYFVTAGHINLLTSPHLQLAEGTEALG